MRSTSPAMVLLLGLAAPALSLAGCSTADPERLSAAQCEELRESKRAQQDGGILSAQDIEDLRVQGC